MAMMCVLGASAVGAHGNFHRNPSLHPNLILTLTLTLTLTLLLQLTAAPTSPDAATGIGHRSKWCGVVWCGVV